jgi:WD40 repeat protein
MTLRISDARTGALLREFKGMPGQARRLVWTEDAKRLYCRTDDEKQVHVVDAETGMVQCSLSKEGHEFTMHRPFEDAAGNAWIFSQDAARNLYAWPMTADGAPRKVFDGTLLGAQGSFKLHVADPDYALFSNYNEDRTYTKTAYALDGRKKLAEWRIPKGNLDWHQPLINRSLIHFVSVGQVDRDIKDPTKKRAFSVYVQGKTAPLFKGRGSPLAVSPDARFLAVQSDDTTACLYEVQTGRAVCQYAADRKENRFPPRMHAAFSDNGSRFVLNTTASLEVTDLAEGYARRSMVVGADARTGWVKPCLSPDGASVLCGGVGGAWLFDAATGALLRSFEEPDPAVRRAFSPGAESSLAEAFFIDGGARVVTLAGKQIIGVWDAGSGALLHTIQTGLSEKRVKNRPVQKSVVFSATGRFAFCHSSDGAAPATLWSLADGTLQRQYKLPAGLFTEAVPADDGTAVYVQSNRNLYRWPGRPKDAGTNP